MVAETKIQGAVCVCLGFRVRGAGCGGERHARACECGYARVYVCAMPLPSRRKAATRCGQCADEAICVPSPCRLQVENRKLKERQRLQVAEEQEQASKEAAEAASGPEIPEDPYYAAVKAAQMQAKQVKAAKYAFPEREYAPVDKVGEGEKRGAGYQITKNRGLVPHRNKDKKNPRVKHRLKYEKAKTKERTSFYGKQARLDNSGAYGGEATGIKANIARSRKLDSKDH